MTHQAQLFWQAAQRSGGTTFGGFQGALPRRYRLPQEPGHTIHQHGQNNGVPIDQAGARVAMNYANNAPRAEAALAELTAEGVTAGLFRADVTSETEIDGMFTAIEGSVEIWHIFKLLCNDGCRKN